MAETDEIARMLGEAEQATAAGNQKAAERALRQALRAQESQFGLVHPDVAGTLNSLGTVCEALGRPQEAEFLYRRALGVARRTLAADHPHIATSLQHLSTLYEDQGRPDRLSKVMQEGLPRSGLPGDASSTEFDIDQFDIEVENLVVEPPPSLPPIVVEPVVDDEPGIVTDDHEGIGVEAVETGVEMGVETTVELPVTAASPEGARAPGALGGSSRANETPFPGLPPQLFGRLTQPTALAAAGIILLALLWLFSGGNGSPGAVGPGPPPDLPTAGVSSEEERSGQPDEASAGEHETARASSVPRRSPEPSVNVAELEEPAGLEGPADLEEPAEGVPTATRSSDPVDGSSDSTLPLADVSWSVAEAEVCAGLTNRGVDGSVLPRWRCEPVGDVVGAGELYFYTRVRSRTPTSVEHRWLRDGVLDRDVDLDVGANDGPGYRTFSSRTVSPGVWRVELRSREQELLHAKEFEVR